VLDKAAEKNPRKLPALSDPQRGGGWGGGGGPILRSLITPKREKGN